MKTLIRTEDGYYSNALLHQIEGHHVVQRMFGARRVER
jgi:hypothetical protein